MVFGRNLNDKKYVFFEKFSSIVRCGLWKIKNEGISCYIWNE